MITKDPNYLSYEEFCELKSKAVLRTVHDGCVCFEKRMFKVGEVILPDTPQPQEGEPVKVFLDPTGLNGGSLVILGLDGLYRCSGHPCKMPARIRLGRKVIWRVSYATSFA